MPTRILLLAGLILGCLAPLAAAEDEPDCRTVETWGRDFETQLAAARGRLATAREELDNQTGWEEKRWAGSLTKVPAIFSSAKSLTEVVSLCRSQGMTRESFESASALASVEELLAMFGKERMSLWAACWKADELDEGLEKYRESIRSLETAVKGLELGVRLANEAKEKLACPGSAGAADLFSGKWKGGWSNTRGDSGTGTIELSCDAEGSCRLSEYSGKITGPDQAELVGIGNSTGYWYEQTFTLGGADSATIEYRVFDREGGKLLYTGTWRVTRPK